MIPLPVLDLAPVREGDTLLARLTRGALGLATPHAA